MTKMSPESQAQFKHMITGYEMSLAVLARFILNASDSFVCVLSVIVTDVSIFSARLTLKPWALYIRLKNGTETILPVAMRVAGSTPRLQESTPFSSRWSQESDILDRFYPYPIISVSDVEHFDNYPQQAPLPWHLRIYRSTVAYAKRLQRATHSIITTREMPRISRKMKF
jgi:hypothetical protein